MARHLSFVTPFRGLLRSTRQLSRASGARDRPLREQTLGKTWHDLVHRFGDRPALISRHENGIRWTYAEMDQRVQRLARGMQEMGIKKGDRVATLQGNSSANVTLQWATAQIGAILVTLNPAYRLEDLVRCLNLVEAKALFAVPRLRASDYVAMLQQARPLLPALEHVVLDDNISKDEPGSFDRLLRSSPDLVAYQDVLQYSSSAPKSESLSNEDVICLQMTSGTTGDPKAVMLTHRNMLNNAVHIGERMRVTERDILLNTPPLFHCFGQILGLLAFQTHGACVVFASESFDPRATIEAIAAEKATALHGVPTMFVRILEEVEKLRKGGRELDISSLRTGIAAGSPVPAPLMARLTSPEWLNLKELTIAFGQTESSPVSFMSQTDDPLDKRIETVGRILPHVDAKVVDPTTGDVIPRGETGELHVAGYLLFKGYWRNEAETQKTLHIDQDGKTWLKTGDLASMDEDGFLSIRGRLKDLIIRSGENITPTRIENILLAHADVADAAAIGVPDDLLGEVVGVFVRRTDAARQNPLNRAALRSFVKERYVQAAPSYVWALGEDEGVPEDWPQTASGKIRKVELRALGAQLASRGMGMA